MHQRNADGAFAHRRRHALHIVGPRIAHREHARQAAGVLHAADEEPAVTLTVAKRPGAKKTAPANQAEAAPAAQAEAAPAAETPAPAAPAAEVPTAAAPVKGLGIAAGARRPGAKKAPEAAPAAPAPAPAPAEAAPAAEPAPASETAPEPDAPKAAPAVEVKGLGIAGGARPPGKKR